MRKFLPVLVLVAACGAWFLIRATTSSSPAAAPESGEESAVEMQAKSGDPALADPALAAPANDGGARGALAADGAATSAPEPLPLVAPGWEPGIPPEIADKQSPEGESKATYDKRLDPPGGAYFDAKYAGLDATARREAIAVLERLLLEEQQRTEPAPKGAVGIRELKMELSWLWLNPDPDQDS